jgi:Anion-transporting ATPase
MHAVTSRRALERLEGMGRGMNRVDLLTILDCGREPVGVERLAAIGRALNRALGNPRRRRDRRRAPAARVAHRSPLPARVPGRKEDRLRATRSRDVRSPQIQDTSARLLLFGGKGGVGKTTCAAAAALAIARAHPERRILLLSTDPAHSLSDALGAHVSDEPTALRGGPPISRFESWMPSQHSGEHGTSTQPRSMGSSIAFSATARSTQATIGA